MIKKSSSLSSRTKITNPLKLKLNTNYILIIKTEFSYFSFSCRLSYRTKSKYTKNNL